MHISSSQCDEIYFIISGFWVNDRHVHVYVSLFVYSSENIEPDEFHGAGAAICYADAHITYMYPLLGNNLTNQMHIVVAK